MILALLKWKFREIINQKIIFTKNRSICDKKGIILIFDECTSGFGKLLVDYTNYTTLNLILRGLEKL